MRGRLPGGWRPDPLCFTSGVENSGSSSSAGMSVCEVEEPKGRIEAAELSQEYFSGFLACFCLEVDLVGVRECELPDLPRLPCTRISGG